METWQDLIPLVDLAPAWREAKKSQGNLSLVPRNPQRRLECWKTIVVTEKRVVPLNCCGVSN